MLNLLHWWGVDKISVILIFSAVLAGLAGWLGIRSVIVDRDRSRWTMTLMILSFVGQLWALSLRGEQRGSCPLMDPGEICMFLSWSMTLFYLLVGTAYRISLLGMFTAPVVTILLLISTLPGMLDPEPLYQNAIDYWGELHAALSVLSYGALALGGVAAVMFLILNNFLKTGRMNSGLFQNMPPVHTLVSSMVRMTVVGLIFLTMGLVFGFFMTTSGGAHLWVAKAVWVAYMSLMVVWFVRGMTPQRMALLIVAMFIASLSVFAAL